MNMILETLGNIGFEPRQALFSIINFLIVYLVVSKFLFPKIGEVVEARKKQVQESINNSTLIETRLSEIETEKNRIIEETKADAAKILETAHSQAKELQELSKNDTAILVQTMIENGQKELIKDREKMFEELKSESAQIIVEALEKILGEKMDNTVNTAYINQKLKTISK